MGHSPEFSKSKDATQAGVYILYNTADKNEQPNIYIGQSGHNVLPIMKKINQELEMIDNSEKE